MLLNYKVTEVISSGNDTLQFLQTDTTLMIYLADRAVYGDETTFKIKYYGKDPETGMHFIDERPDNPEWQLQTPGPIRHITGFHVMMFRMIRLLRKSSYIFLHIIKHFPTVNCRVLEVSKKVSVPGTGSRICRTVLTCLCWQ